MNKSELTEALAANTGLPKSTAANVVAALFDGDGIIAATLKGGNEVNITGFGSFKVHTRAARQGINPATKAKIQIAAKNALKFKIGKNLGEAIA